MNLVVGRKYERDRALSRHHAQLAELFTMLVNLHSVTAVKLRPTLRVSGKKPEYPCPIHSTVRLDRPVEFLLQASGPNCLDARATPRMTRSGSIVASEGSGGRLGNYADPAAARSA